MARSIVGVTPAAMTRLAEYPWPGNIRELRNVIERAFVLETGDVIGLESLPFNLQASPPRSTPPSSDDPFSGYPAQLAPARQLFERNFVLAALRRYGGNVSVTAQALDVPRNTLYRRMEALGITSLARALERAGQSGRTDE